VLILLVTSTILIIPINLLIILKDICWLVSGRCKESIPLYLKNIDLLLYYIYRYKVEVLIKNFEYIYM